MSRLKEYARVAEGKIGPLRRKDSPPIQRVEHAAVLQAAYSRAQVNGAMLTATDALVLQRTVGNRKLQRYVGSHPLNPQIRMGHESTREVGQNGAKSAASFVIQRNGGSSQTNLQKLDELLDRLNVPEEEVIDLLGRLTTPEKNAVLAGGYQSKIASALNIGEMVRAVNNLNPELAVKLRWVESAASIRSSIDYSNIKGLIKAAPQPQRDALKTDTWRNFFVKVCTNATMIEAVKDLGWELETQLRWIEAETTSARELDYSDIKGLIKAAPQPQRDALKTDTWRNFFVKVCTNATMIEAVKDLGWELETQLRWIEAETTSTRELDYSDIKGLIKAAPQPQRDALKTDTWRNFFVAVCNNKTIEEALVDLSYDIETQVRWMIAESDKEAVLDTATFMTRVRLAPNFTDLMKMLVDVSALPAGMIQDAVAQLAGSELEVDRNTAHQILEGSIAAFYIENLQQPANVNAEVTAAGLNPTLFTVYLEPPENTNKMFVQRNAVAFTATPRKILWF